MTLRKLIPLAMLVVGCAHSQKAAGALDAKAVVSAPDRSADDQALDPGRKPAEMLEFIGVAPGMKVAELFAGGGYTTELLARAVGPTGTVYGENSKMVLEKFAEKPWSERLSKPVNANVVRVDRELDDPLPPEAKGLDAVVSNAIYHDTVWLQVDRAKMNKAVFDALRPGGVYVVIDSSAKAGSGDADVQSLHRIDEELVKREVQAAGFELATTSEFLRNPADARDWSAAPPAAAAAQKRGTSDRFALKFVKK